LFLHHDYADKGRIKSETARKSTKLQVTEVGWSFSLLKLVFFKGIYTLDPAKAMIVYVYGCVYDLEEFPIVK
jgi:hypothetical protein